MDLFEGIFLRILPYGKSSLLYCHIWENMFFFWFQASYYANLKQQTRTTITTTGTGFSFFGKIVEITTNVSMYVVDGRKT